MSFEFNQFLEHFHFVRPWWLLAFLLLFIIVRLLKKQQHFNSPWQQLLPKHLANVVLETSNSNVSKQQNSSAFSNVMLKPIILGSCVILALAGPAWQKVPQPVYQLERGAVLIMDMSYSMYATDLKPNRLTRARFKAVDLLKALNEGEIGLIAYAGDAFTISPLTKDIKNIELLLPSLSPEIMPLLGANAFAALSMAHDTLINAGHVNGDIYWFTDDIDNEEMSDIYNWANEYGHRINILGIGTANGAPIKLSSGELLKDKSGAIVVPKLPEGKLASIAKRARGQYSTITHGDADIRLLVQSSVNHNNDDINQDKEEQQLLQGDQYYEQGPWLIIIMLPLLLSYFRRGVLISFAPVLPLLLVTGLLNSHNAIANNEVIPQVSESNPTTETNAATSLQSSSESKVKSFWNNLWQTPDQQGQNHFEQQQYQQAANQFDNTQWQGSAHYKAGNYQQALEAFQQSDSGEALYNQGNALAQLQQFDQAIEAYKKALAKDESLTDAKENLEKIEALKKQQEQQQGEQQQGEQQQGEQQQGEQQQGEQQQGEQQQGEQQQGEQQQGEQQQGEQQQGEQQQGEQQQGEQQQGEQQQGEQQQGEQQQVAKEGEESVQEPDEKTAASTMLDKQAKETEQKHQQLLNKVTDDPYLLLRNKMKLEYQKRQQGGSRKGAEKQW